jgi:hypothetical protein
MRLHLTKHQLNLIRQGKDPFKRFKAPVYAPLATRTPYLRGPTKKPGGKTYVPISKRTPG